MSFQEQLQYLDLNVCGCDNHINHKNVGVMSTKWSSNAKDLHTAALKYNLVVKKKTTDIKTITTMMIQNEKSE